jgi:hypothetical protein
MADEIDLRAELDALERKLMSRLDALERMLLTASEEGDRAAEALRQQLTRLGQRVDELERARR